MFRIFRRCQRILSQQHRRFVLGIFRDILRSGYAPGIHWGQDAEDAFLVDVLPDVGFYVDVGAHHPHRFSSTKLLYDRGWSGLNIDVTNSMRTLFPKSRPRDQFHFGLVGHPRTTTFFRFFEGAISTIDEEIYRELIASGRKLKAKEDVILEPLELILSRHNVPETIDLLCIDAEGADLEVLQTVDFEKRKVKMVLVEVHTPAWALAKHPITIFLDNQGFQPVAVWLRSALFERRSDAG